jgi:hypothetical protein
VQRVLKASKAHKASRALGGNRAAPAALPVPPGRKDLQAPKVPPAHLEPSALPAPRARLARPEPTAPLAHLEPSALPAPRARLARPEPTGPRARRARSRRRLWWRERLRASRETLPTEPSPRLRR